MNRAPVLPLDFGTHHERFEGVEQIAVLRGGGLGDLLFVVPAIEALSAAYPDARLTLLGMPLHRQLVGGRLAVDLDVEELPYCPGVRDGADRAPTTEAFFTRNAGRYDLAVQLHGGGRHSNPFLLGLHAQHNVGSGTGDAQPLERILPYVYYQHEVVRALEVAALAGAAPVTLEPRIIPLDADRAAGSRLLGGQASNTVVIHPGATDERRRWPAGEFGEVAARLVSDGWRVAIVGDEAEVPLAMSVVNAARRRLPSRFAGGVFSLAGGLSLGALVGVIAECAGYLGNDSGPRHLAQAVGTPTVGIYWFGNLINAGPLLRGSHRVRLGWATTCPVCGRDVTQVGWTAERCEHETSFVDDVNLDEVYADLCEVMATTAPVRGR